MRINSVLSVAIGLATISFSFSAVDSVSFPEISTLQATKLYLLLFAATFRVSQFVILSLCEIKQIPMLCRLWKFKTLSPLFLARAYSHTATQAVMLLW